MPPTSTLRAPTIASTHPANPLDIGALYVRYEGAVRRRVRSFVSPQDVDELVQDVFTKALEKRESFRGDSAPLTWLYRIATNLCLNRIQSSRRRRQLLSENAPAMKRLQIVRPNQETSVFLESLWRTLDNETALIGIYYFVDDLSHREIAELVGVSPRTIGNRIQSLVATAREAATGPERGGLA